MTRFYTQDNQFVAVRFCGNKPSSFWLTEAQRELVACQSIQQVLGDDGSVYSAGDFLALLAKANLAGPDEVQFRFETLNLDNR